MSNGQSTWLDTILKWAIFSRVLSRSAWLLQVLRLKLGFCGDFRTSGGEGARTLLTLGSWTASRLWAGSEARVSVGRVFDGAHTVSLRLIILTSGQVEYLYAIQDMHAGPGRVSRDDLECRILGTMGTHHPV